MAEIDLDWEVNVARVSVRRYAGMIQKIKAKKESNPDRLKMYERLISQDLDLLRWAGVNTNQHLSH